MTMRAFASLAVKLLGLYTITQSLSSLVLASIPLLRILNNNVSCGPVGCFPDWSQVAPSISMGVMQFCVGVGLWLWSEAVARVLVKDKEPHLPVPEANWRAIGFNLLGVFLIVDGFSQLVGFYVSQLHSYGFSIPPQILLSVFVRDLIAVCLLFGARVVRGLLNFKNWGRDAQDIR